MNIYAFLCYGFTIFVMESNLEKILQFIFIVDFRCKVLFNSQQMILTFVFNSVEFYLLFYSLEGQDWGFSSFRIKIDKEFQDKDKERKGKIFHKLSIENIASRAAVQCILYHIKTHEILKNFPPLT